MFDSLDLFIFLFYSIFFNVNFLICLIQFKVTFTFFNPIIAYPTIKALINSSVGLPCNISQTKEENSIKLILWYKNNVLGTPIYSIDARSHNISQARHFVAPPYQDRATFELNLSARIAILFVKPLRGDDDGHYICRVDFRWTRTTISTVKLDVISKCILLTALLFSFYFVRKLTIQNKQTNEKWYKIGNFFVVSNVAMHNNKYMDVC